MKNEKGTRLIKCKFCTWKTNLWGRGSNPGRAFRRLQHHVLEEHDIPEALLECIEANLDDFEQEQP